MDPNWLADTTLDPVGQLATYGITGLVAAIFLMGIIFTQRRLDKTQAQWREDGDAAVARLERQLAEEKARGEKALSDEKERSKIMLAAAEDRAVEERRRAERLADELSRSIQNVQAQAMAAVTEAQQLVRQTLQNGGR